MNLFEDDFIDAIATNLPWNIYEHKEEDYVEFYLKMLQEMKSVVKQNGRNVILMGNEYEFEKVLSKINLELNDKLSVLINGKKAKVYILTVK
jgi:tRNA G10  N-methylase Trm11